MKKKDSPATSEDITDLASAINQLQNSVDKGLGIINKKIDRLETGQVRLENKLDATVDKVDEHSVDIRGLKQNLA